ncbi:MAG: penicillin-binding protein activator [Alphaproteobacteria bacterium]|nr:penicillin-binding protein activator [Alphaproteobacteria bacterium]
MLKKIAVYFLVLGLIGCGNRLTDNRIEIANQKYDIIDYDAISDEMYKIDALNVSVLLPLSGKAENIGKGMQNAMFMALSDQRDNNVILKFYDTKSTALGAKDAAENAIKEGSELILGPLMFEEVESVAPVALKYDIPIVSFTTSPQVLQKGIYSIGLLNGEQIERVLSYAKSKGKTNLALVVPDNNSGLNVLKSALGSAQNKGIKLVKVGFYNQSSIDFTSLIKSMSEEKDFDAVLIADGGNRLKSLASMFAYNDIMYPEVLFMGTSAWDNTNLSKETILYHGVYPMVSKNYVSYFNGKYKETFGEMPKSIYSLAYDGVLLAATLSMKNTDITESLTSKSGFIGVNGYFKVLPTGQSWHSLEVYEITSNGPKVVAQGEKNAEYVENEFDVRYISYDALPKVYGKNNSEVLKWLYNN